MIVFIIITYYAGFGTARLWKRQIFFPADIDLTGIICNNSIIHRKRNPRKDRSNQNAPRRGKDNNVGRQDS